MCLTAPRPLNVESDFCHLSLIMQRKIPKERIMNPWKISPNMTPNKKGKVTIVNSPGLISRYRGIP